MAAQPSASSPGSEDEAAKDKKKASTKEIVLPKSAYFRLEDTSNEVRIIREGGLAAPPRLLFSSCFILTIAWQIYGKAKERFDPTKRGGRYKSDFIWNENWQETMKRDEDLDRKRRQFLEAQDQQPGASSSSSSSTIQQPGAVSLGLLAQLDNMDVDLSAALLPKKKDPTPDVRTKASSSSTSSAISVPIPRLNAEKLKRTSRITKPKSVFSEKDEDEEERLRVIRAEREAFEAKKLDFLTWTLALTALGSITTFQLYDQNVAASYTVGALGGIIYLRLLGKSVDSVGSQSIEGGLGSMASQPRLLIPVLLAFIFNRWNLLYSAKFEITLQLLPMLIGFFTYKIAVLSRESQDVMKDLSKRPESQEP